MHIIGIRIEKGCDPDIIKNLKPDWYPFGDYEEPQKENGYKWRKGDSLSDRLYQIDPGMPQISVSCVIGMNGSGKTTLFDVLYRILNNFAYSFASKPTFDLYALNLAKSLKAKLYFDIDNTLGCIIDNNGVTKLYKCANDNQGWIPEVEPYLDVLPELFYTIGINYSIYSMDFEEYDGLNETPRNYWLSCLFKNQLDYYVPITLSPYRYNGQIDIKHEKYHANKRIITLSLLLHSQEKQLITGYTPVEIKYSLNTEYINSIKEQVNHLAIVRKGQIQEGDYIIENFKIAWKKAMKVDSCFKDIEEQIFESLACESARISLTYKDYSDLFAIDDIRQAESDALNPKEIASKGNYDTVVNKIIKVGNASSLTSDIYQILYFLSNPQIKEHELGSVSIDELINKLSDKSYEEAYKFLPPLFYKVDLMLKKDDGNTFLLSQLSSGEKQLLYSNSAILYHIYNIANSKIKNDNRIVPYEHISIILDEAELYAHPEFQRKYIFSLIDMLKGLHIANSVIKSIHLIIATHSPFILSDIPIENVLYLENGKRIERRSNAFCANIYDILKNSFFLEYPMGEIAKRLLDTIVQAYNSDDKSLKQEINSEIPFYSYIIKNISDEYIRDTAKFMLESMSNEKIDIQ